MAKEPQKQYHRSDIFLDWFVQPYIRKRVHGMYDLEVEGADHLKTIREGAALIMPKHTSDVYDVMIEAILLRDYARRNGNYLMKESLQEKLQERYGAAKGSMVWRFMHWGGGFPVITEQEKDEEIKGLEVVIADKEELKSTVRAVKRKFLTVNGKAMDHVDYLYAHNQVVVCHPEGMTYPDSVGPPSSLGPFKSLWKNQQALSKEIPVIPIGFQYEDLATKGSIVLVRIGEPRVYSAESLNTIAEDVMNRLRVLSGF